MICRPRLLSTVSFCVACTVLMGICLLPPAATAEPPIPPFAAAAAQEITADTLAAPIRFLSSDLLGGRGPATPGDRLTQEYLASQMEFLGLEPGAEDGSWYQPFDIVGVTAELPASWSFQQGEYQVSLPVREQWVAFSGVQEPRAAIEDAELVFVGYGIEAPEYDWDDYKGADLAGKVLVMLNNDPDWDPELFEGDRRLYYGRWTYKYEVAARQGAVGAIVIHTTPSAGYPWQVVETSWTGPQFELPARPGEPRLEIGAWLTEDAARQVLELAEQDLDELTEAARSRDFRPVPLGVRTSLALTNDIQKARTANVLGLLPGRDSQLAREAVVYTAHHDHLGTAEDGEDRIYNGALDNGAGMAQLLAIAKALTALPEPPRRSVLFLFVAAEEQGLLGSEFYAIHPTFPPGRIAANLNYDGGNIWGATRDVTLIGMGKSSLDEVARTVAARQGRVLKPDQFPDKGFYYRSDQFNFAKIGVPALYFDTGTEFVGKPEGWGKETLDAWTEEHYHQPSDEIDDSWNFDGMIQDARLGLFAGLIVAEADELPTWTPGDEFEAARREALEALPKGDDTP